jgi:hypothetical protein
MSNYIIFSAYYKGGETQTVLSKSFQDCFGILIKSIYDFIQLHYELLDEYNEYKEEDMEEESEIIMEKIWVETNFEVRYFRR